MINLSIPIFGHQKKLNAEEEKLMEKLRNMPNFKPSPGKSDKGFFDRMKDYFG